MPKIEEENRDLEPEAEKIFPLSVLPGEAQAALVAEIKDKLISLRQDPAPSEKKTKLSKKSSRLEENPLIYIITDINPLEGRVNPSIEFTYPIETSLKQFAMTSFGPFTPEMASAIAYLFSETFILRHTQAIGVPYQQREIQHLPDFARGMTRLILDLVQAAKSHSSLEILAEAISGSRSKLEVNYLEKKNAYDQQISKDPDSAQKGYAWEELLKAVDQLAGLEHAFVLINQLTRYPWLSKPESHLSIDSSE